jgi:hypothetical protein
MSRNIVSYDDLVSSAYPMVKIVSGPTPIGETPRPPPSQGRGQASGSGSGSRAYVPGYVNHAGRGYPQSYNNNNNGNNSRGRGAGRSGGNGGHSSGGGSSGRGQPPSKRQKRNQQYGHGNNNRPGHQHWDDPPADFKDDPNSPFTPAFQAVLAARGRGAGASGSAGANGARGAGGAGGTRGGHGVQGGVGQDVRGAYKDSEGRYRDRDGELLRVWGGPMAQIAMERKLKGETGKWQIPEDERLEPNPYASDYEEEGDEEEVEGTLDQDEDEEQDDEEEWEDDDDEEEEEDEEETAIDLTAEEAWDDSALVDAWNAAQEEYLVRIFFISALILDSLLKLEIPRCVASERTRRRLEERARE